ncbi:mannose-1-phosphate guanylyltransferase/mannose-6-phosphate isomerase [Helicobacter anatolicus]|uniref:mannose-1-phosphate guanylyltransferase/mannose-6-phosphate isomerase n=1 Tax=Helicobacter anatolicus TaxID=2905874 RepID=UPI002FCE5D77
MLKIVILCGGSGTRLWPLSREDYPKQFSKILGNRSLFQETLLRNLVLEKEESAEIEIISNEKYHFLLENQSSEISQTIHHYILESLPKNTAAAIAFSAFNAKEKDILLVLPSDHLISNKELYYKTVKKAMEFARHGYLVTFGISPTSPHTGYGYIKSNQGVVECFKEKPDYNLAKSYFEDGGYFWNSGMFCFEAGVFLQELKTYAEEIFLSTKLAFQKARKRNNAFFIPQDMSEKIPSNSIDYAVLEKSQKVFCLESHFDWNDVGSFDSLSQEFGKKKEGFNPIKVVSKESKNNFIMSDKLVATIGIEDLIIIDTPDSLLVSKKNQTQAIKDILPQVQKIAPHLIRTHQITYRPWGYYQILLETQTYKIKQIVIKPKSRLSLQKHFHRNEHWIVVSGRANVTLEDKVFILEPNQSTYIPQEKIHRLANLEEEDLVVIEVQMGSYLGEDDIVRLEDDFSRC